MSGAQRLPKAWEALAETISLLNAGLGLGAASDGDDVGVDAQLAQRSPDLVHV
jgi:hypothetical protein